MLHMVEKKGGVTLTEADHAWNRLQWKDPGITREEVAEIYVEAERVARAMDRGVGETVFSRLPTVMERLKSLGFDPETLEPLPPESEEK